MIGLLFRFFCILAIIVVVFVALKRKTHSDNEDFEWDQTIQRKADGPIKKGAASHAVKNFIDGNGHGVDFNPAFKVCGNCEYWCGNRKKSSRQGHVHVVDSLEKSKCSNKNRMGKFPFNQFCPCQGTCEHWERWHAL